MAKIPNQQYSGKPNRRLLIYLFHKLKKTGDDMQKLKYLIIIFLLIIVPTLKVEARHIASCEYMVPVVNENGQTQGISLIMYLEDDGSITPSKESNNNYIPDDTGATIENGHMWTYEITGYKEALYNKATKTISSCPNLTAGVGWNQDP